MLRATRWRGNMYLPPLRRARTKFASHLIELRHAQSSMRLLLTLFVLSLVTAFPVALRTARNRKRYADTTLATRRRGRRIVIVGGGTGGAALAAQLTRLLPHCHVTVIERERTQTFHALTPLALVGHRSYDINTTTGSDTLRAPASWNVTRDALLVHGSVERVLPRRQCVLVRAPSSPSPPAAAAADSDASRHGDDAATATATVGAVWSRLRMLCTLRRAPAPLPTRHEQWQRVPRHYRARLRSQSNRSNDDADDDDDVDSEVVAVHADGSSTRRDGLRSYPYDVLVLACGAERVLGVLDGCLRAQQLDRFRVTVNPGPTRDALSHVFAGNVVHVKVPPRSLVAAAQAAREHTRQHANDNDDDDTTRTTLSSTATTSSVNTTTRRIVLPDRYEAGDDAALAPLLYPLDDLDNNSNNKNSNNAAPQCDDATTAPHVDVPLLYEARQHEGLFASSVNTVCKYLDYTNKFGLCRYYAVTADAEVLPCVPACVRDAVLRAWAQRRRATRAHAHKDARFALLTHTYITGVHSRTDGAGTQNLLTLYNYKHDVEVVLPFQLLLLDLSLRAPTFVRASGLHRIAYTRPRSNSSNNNNTNNSNNNNNDALARLHEVAYEQEASFADVDAQTLQHTRHANVFALGDVAGLPTVKSYGATLTQVHVVAHNVQRYMEQLQQQQQQQQQQQRSTSAVTRTQAATSPPPTRAAARYDGYTSFPIMMTTWRAMWPEMRYNAAQRAAFAAAAAAVDDGHHDDDHTRSDDADVATTDTTTTTTTVNDATVPLEHVDNHLWRNTSWRGLGGWCNAAYYQLALYELMYFHVFVRGTWHPPSWFVLPRYSPDDGSVEPSRGWLAWL